MSTSRRTLKRFFFKKNHPASPDRIYRRSDSAPVVTMGLHFLLLSTLRRSNDVRNLKSLRDLRRRFRPRVSAVLCLLSRAARTRNITRLLRHHPPVFKLAIVGASVVRATSSTIRRVTSSVSRSTATAKTADLANASSIVVSACFCPSFSK